MSTPVFYILIVLVLTSAMISTIFFIAWKTLVQKPFTLTWSLAFLAATCQWTATLARAEFPNFQSYWLTTNALAMILITLGVRGHCQRTACSLRPGQLWLAAGVVFAGVIWTSVVTTHVGISTALVPAAAALSLFLSAAIVASYREAVRPAEYAAVVMMILFGVLQVIAALLALRQGAAGNDEYRAVFQHFNFLTLPAGYIGVSMFIIFMLASDLSEKMKEIAVVDQLTGLLNRRGFGEQGAVAYASARRSSRPVSVIMTDIDRFKFINDAHGHAVGDRALQHFSAILKSGRRTDDTIARVGGEEFALILPGTELHDAIAVAEGLCADIESTPMQVDEKELRMTASFGVSTISKNDTGLGDIVIRADRALYRSKRAGRNRVDIESSQALKYKGGSLRPVAAE
ncbi:MAG TPA: GGDEF domain-containing protein [Woeseiaceae bacterium]|nr:GGDEF domain-containing protein [Woeseiaceae bacterium]